MPEPGAKCSRCLKTVTNHRSGVCSPCRGNKYGNKVNYPKGRARRVTIGDYSYSIEDAMITMGVKESRL